LLPLTFGNKDDFEKIQEKDRITISGLDTLTQGETLTVHINHDDGSTAEIIVEHSLNEKEIQWFNHGSALNYVGSQK
ncbi:MAG: aconitate hydratase, partial [Pelagibacteraceae bacterium]|nr:aconitate hydratase [Pelagibacteraceae bacterium]